MEKTAQTEIHRETTQIPPVNILLADDSPEILLTIQSLLEKEKLARVLSFPSATESWEWLNERGNAMPLLVPDLIILDLNMPGLSGLEACRILKSDPRFKDIPVIIVTASPDIKNLEEAFSAGASDFIFKPIHHIELLTRVRSALLLKSETDARKARERELLAVKAELELANQELADQASRDGLTGLANRRQFDKRLYEEWHRARREFQPLGLLMLDIDHFKRYNDTYGHLIGDHCLQQVARALKGTISRATDLAARYGGEEFGIILPNTPLKGTMVVGQRILSHIRMMGMPHQGISATAILTVSIGAASIIPSVSGKQDQLIKAADTALYHAKNSGRNMLVSADQVPQS